MGDIFLQLQGVDLTDRRWYTSPSNTPLGRPLTGAWDVLRGTSLLPSAPRYRRTRFERPSQHGESRAQFSPIAPKSHMIVMRFYAIDSNPNSPMYKTLPTTPGGRVQAIQENMNEFFFRTQLGANGSKGYLELSRRYSVNGDPQYANVDVDGEEEPEYEPDYRWADYHMIFRNPYGTWTGEEITITRDITRGNTEVRLPMGTAQVWDMKIAMRPNDYELPPGSTFVNDQGVGFRMAYLTRNWWIMDTVTRMAGHASSGTNPNWDITLNNARLIEEMGRPQGTALLLNPGVTGSYEREALIRVNPRVDSRVIFRYRPRYF